MNNDIHKIKKYTYIFPAKVSTDALLDTKTKSTESQLSAETIEKVSMDVDSKIKTIFMYRLCMNIDLVSITVRMVKCYYDQL